MLKYPKKIKKFVDARRIMKQHDHKILGLHPNLSGTAGECLDGQWGLIIFATSYHPSFRFFEKI